MRIYLAGPIFFLADKFRNDYFYNKLLCVPKYYLWTMVMVGVVGFAPTRYY